MKTEPTKEELIKYLIEGLTLKEIADKHGTNHQRISQLLTKHLKK